MIRCKTCVMPDTRPDHEFVDGECPACVNAAAPIDEEEGLPALLTLLDRHDGRVIVPSSGGKDSHYQVKTLVDLGADVTIVTARTCHLTPAGRANIDNLSRYARTIEVAPDMSVRAKLNRLALEWVGDISWPEHAAIFSTPFRVAAETGIKLIMYGENPQRQYGGPPGTEEALQMTERWCSEFGGFLGLRPADFVGNDGITARDMDDYMPVYRIGVEAHFLGQYQNWDSHRNGRVARQMGMQQFRPCAANWWQHENVDNAQTGLHDHLMFLKYGYGRGCTQISVDVRNGIVERDAALRWVHKYDGIFPDEYAGVSFADMASRIGLTPSKLNEAMSSHTNWELFDEGEFRGEKLTLLC